MALISNKCNFAIKNKIAVICRAEAIFFDWLAIVITAYLNLKSNYKRGTRVAGISVARW